MQESIIDIDKPLFHDVDFQWLILALKSTTEVARLFQRNMSISMQESIIDFESCSRTSSARSAARFNHLNWNRHGSSTAISYAPGSTVQESMQESNSLIDSCIDSAATHEYNLDFMQRRTTCARINNWNRHLKSCWKSTSSNYRCRFQCQFQSASNNPLSISMSISIIESMIDSCTVEHHL